MKVLHTYMNFTYICGHKYVMTNTCMSCHGMIVDIDIDICCPSSTGIFFSVFLVGSSVVIYGSLKLFRQSMDIIFPVVFNHNVNGNININVFVPNVVTFGTCV